MSSSARVRPRLLALRRTARRLTGGAPEPIAEGVWRMRGGTPRTMNVYFVREQDGGGVLMFDAGVRAMVHQVREEAAALGGLTRVVLGHGHADHRGTAPSLAVPVLCHVDERAFAEGDGGEHTFDFSKLDQPARTIGRSVLHSWDGGPVRIAATLEEGERIAGFRVVHLPGHSPGQIALWRESDRLALCTDAFYTLDPQTGRKGRPRIAHAAFTPDRAQAADSMRKLAALEPAAAWPGHADPVLGDVRAQLEAAAARG